MVREYEQERRMLLITRAAEKAWLVPFL